MVTPRFFFALVGHYLTAAKVFKKFELGKILGANVLKESHSYTPYLYLTAGEENDSCRSTRAFR